MENENWQEELDKLVSLSESDTAVQKFSKNAIKNMFKKTMSSMLYEIELKNNSTLVTSEFIGYGVAKDELRERKNEIAQKYGLV